MMRLVAGEALHDLHGVGAGAAYVRFRLDGRRRVHVGHHHGVGVLSLELAQARHRDHVRHGAARALVRHEHRLLRREDDGRLGHEVHAAEQDDLVLVALGDAGQLQRVAGVVGGVLHLGALVVVGQDHGVALGGEPAQLTLQVREVGSVRHGVHLLESVVKVVPEYTRCARVGDGVRPLCARLWTTAPRRTRGLRARARRAPARGLTPGLVRPPGRPQGGASAQGRAARPGAGEADR